MLSKVRKNLLLMPIDCEDKDFTLIEDNLYLGNKELAHNQYSLKKFGISLVIAVYPKELISLSLQILPQNCRFYHIDAKDFTYEDLISHFDHCFDLITEELDENEGKVLVYCGAGYSRSVTIICAYLMKKYRISTEESVQRVKQLRDKINPNKGFLAQLKTYEDMDYVLDVRHPEYRIFSLIALKKHIWSDKYWEDSRVGALNRQFCEPIHSYFMKISKTNNKFEGERPSVPSVYYLCLKCKHNLFEELNVLLSIEEKSESEDSVNCNHLFIEPQKWMIPLICTKRKSELLCPNCSVVLGSYKWKSYKDNNCILHSGLQDSKICKIQMSSIVKTSTEP